MSFDTYVNEVATCANAVKTLVSLAMIVIPVCTRLFKKTLSTLQLATISDN